MSEPQPEPAADAPLRALVQASVSSVVLGALFYLVLGYALQLESLKTLPYVEWVRIGLAVFAALFSFVINFRDFRERVRARARTARVDEALKKTAGEGDAGAVVSVSASDVATQVGSNAEDQELAQLIEQRRQRLLVDQKTLTPELTYLVNHWHPLPRDVKRGLNRFYVTYLVAYNRGLLSGEDPVSGLQLAKWLVLSERWPQLGRALAVWPKRMKGLEEEAAGLGDGIDTYKTSLASLAPLSVDDANLRTFLQSEPPLAPVLERLVEYGTVQPVQKTGQTEPMAQTPRTSTAAETK
jgi:hypothetical protein